MNTYIIIRKPQVSFNRGEAKPVPEEKHMQKILRELDDGAKEAMRKKDFIGLRTVYESVDDVCIEAK